MYDFSVRGRYEQYPGSHGYRGTGRYHQNFKILGTAEDRVLRKFQKLGTAGYRVKFNIRILRTEKNSNFWVPMITGQIKNLWVPIRTGYGPNKKNRWYRWVPGTSQKKISGTGCRPGKILGIAYRPNFMRTPVSSYFQIFQIHNLKIQTKQI